MPLKIFKKIFNIINNNKLLLGTILFLLTLSIGISIVFITIFDYQSSQSLVTTRLIVDFILIALFIIVIVYYIATKTKHTRMLIQAMQDLLNKKENSESFDQLTKANDEVGTAIKSYRALLDKIWEQEVKNIKELYKYEQNEKDLKAQNQHLEELVRIRTLEIEKANKQLQRTEQNLKSATKRIEEFNRNRITFLANMGHEIRTPMNGIFGMLSLVLQTPLSSEQRDYLETANKSSLVLMSLLNDILDYSKVEEGKFEIEEIEFDLLELIEDVTQLFIEPSYMKKIELVISIDNNLPQWVLGDPNRLRQVLFNLISNAIKFTESGEIVVSASVTKQAAKSTAVKFMIKDTGIGIHKAMQAYIFNAIGPLEANLSSQYGGTGIGLPLCKKLITRMGGTIDFASDLGKGSTFWFELNFKHALGGKKEFVPSALLQGIHMLIVDDNSTNRQVLETVFKKWGIEFVSVENGIKAMKLIEALDAPRFDIAVLDYMMPEMDGLELATKIHTMPAFKQTAIVILSSSIIRPSDEKLIQAGVNQFIFKPFRYEHFHNILTKLLKLTSTQDETLMEETKISAISEKLKSCKDANILLVDDNMVSQKVAFAMLKKLGFTADSANNGEEALRMSSAKRYDIIFMDCLMPGMNGFIATRSIREKEQKGSHIPIIAMTALAMTTDKQACFDAGMDDYMLKPIKIMDLAEKLNKFLSPTTMNMQVTPVYSDKASNDFDLINVIEFNKSKEMMQDSFKNLLKEFIADTQKLIENIQLLIQKEDYEEIKNITHQIKSTSLIFGAVALNKITLEIEMLARKSDFLNIKQKINTLETIFFATRQQLNKLADISLQAEEAINEVENIEKKSRVLIADDNPTVRKILRNKLETLECISSVIEGKDGQEAMELFLKYKPNVLLLDAEMPKKLGSEVCGDARTYTFGKDIPIVLITSSENKDLLKQSYHSGASEFIRKPINWNLIKNFMSEVIQIYNLLANMKLYFSSSISSLNIPQSSQINITKMNSLIDEFKSWLAVDAFSRFQQIVNLSENILDSVSGTKTTMIDTELLLSFKDQFPDTYDNLLNEFLKNIEGLLENIRSAIEANNADELQHYARELKSLCLTFGVADMGEIAIKFQTLAQQNSFMEALTLLNNAKEILAVIQNEINDLLSKAHFEKKDINIRIENKKILIVDDNPTMRKLVSTHLKKLMPIIIEAKNGEESINLYKEFQPDIIFMDIDMPNLDGFATSQQIRSLPTAKFVPILMMSNLIDEEIISKIVALGANDFIDKPINWKNMLYITQQILTTSEYLNQMNTIVRTLQFAGLAKPFRKEDMQKMLTWIDLLNNYLSRKRLFSDYMLRRDICAYENEMKIELPLLDNEIFASAKANFGEDFPDILETFIIDLKKQINVMEQSIFQKNYDELRSSSHQLKSESATFGALRISALAKDLEEMAAQSSLKDAEDCLSEIKRLSNLVMVKLTDNS